MIKTWRFVGFIYLFYTYPLCAWRDLYSSQDLPLKECILNETLRRHEARKETVTFYLNTALQVAWKYADKNHCIELETPSSRPMMRYFFFFPPFFVLFSSFLFYFSSSSFCFISLFSALQRRRIKSLVYIIVQLSYPRLTVIFRP